MPLIGFQNFASTSQFCVMTSLNFDHFWGVELYIYWRFTSIKRCTNRQYCLFTVGTRLKLISFIGSPPVSFFLCGQTLYVTVGITVSNSFCKSINTWTTPALLVLVRYIICTRQVFRSSSDTEWHNYSMVSGATSAETSRCRYIGSWAQSSTSVKTSCNENFALVICAALGVV